MNDPAAHIEPHEMSAWPTLWRRARLAVAVLLGWGVLHYLVSVPLLPAGVERPLVVLVGASGVQIVAALVALALLIVVAVAGVWISGPRREGQALVVGGLTLALWACTGGTMDTWLAMVNVQPSGPSATPYWLLLPEYLYWAVALAAVQVVAARLQPSGPAGESGKRVAGLRLDRSDATIGLQSLAITCVLAIFLLMILNGPILGHTYRGQVYFAVGMAFFVGVVVARQMGRIDRLVWLLPAPLIVGVIGVVWAAMRPALPGIYANVDIIPASGLVRALPVEMMAAGLVAIIWSHRVGEHLTVEKGTAL